jgi:hypothetical protein
VNHVLRHGAPSLLLSPEHLRHRRRPYRVLGVYSHTLAQARRLVPVTAVRP